MNKEVKYKSDLFSSNLINKLILKNQVLIKKVNIKYFLSLRLLACLLIWLLSFTLLKAYFYVGIIFSIIFWILLEYFVFDIKINKINKEIEYNIKSYFESLYILLGENDLKKSLKMLVENNKDIISYYLNTCLDETANGKDLIISLSELKNIIPNQSFKNILFIIIKSEKFNLNLKENLFNELKELKENENYKKKLKASQLFIKVFLVSILLLGPIIYLIIFLPNLLNN